MEAKGHSFVVTNRDSQIINQLLDKYKIKHEIRNKRPVKKSLLSTILYLLGIILFCIKKSLKERPDMYLGFASSPAAVTAFLFRKPSILLDDTEHNKVNHALYKPFCSVVLTPFYFKKKLGPNQLYFNSYVEQLYLHIEFFSPNVEVVRELCLENIDYALVRYIAYDARHDSEVKPLSEDLKKQLVLELSKKMKVLVSAESDKVDEFYKPYLVRVSPEKMHDVIANASFFLTEGATMASEACMLGVPYLYINPLQSLGYILEQVKTYPQLACQSADDSRVMELLSKRIQNDNLSTNKEEWRKAIEDKTINPTRLLVWFVENYPESAKILKENPDFQFKFK
jgi:predicted glycosyltransferase